MDYQVWYDRISTPFRSEGASRAVNMLDRTLVLVIAVAYIVALAHLAITGDARFWRVLFVPAATFAIVTALRIVLNAARPYELYDIDPIIHKDTQGKSLPSRHLASAVIIACALAWLNLPIGAIAFAACTVVAFTRVVGGVHFPRDIVAAIALSALCGFIGFVLVP